jgi:protein O-mannosyl-transferase
VGGIAFIVIATSIAYVPSYHGGFLLDDEGMITQNPLIIGPHGLGRLWFTTEPQDYWPLTYTTFWLEWRIWGNNPTGYHIVNLTLHIGTALLIWAILSRLSLPGGFLAAVLFALHPVNVESVAWISQRKNTLSLLFFLLSILWYLKFDVSLLSCNLSGGRHAQSEFSDRTHGAGWYCLSLLAFVLASLSKGSVVILPLILLGLVWWRRKIEKADLLRLSPFFIVAAVFAMVNVWFQSKGLQESIRNANLTERLLGAGTVVWFYLSKALWPFDLAFIYPRWNIQVDRWQWWLPLLAAIGLTVALWWKRFTEWGRPLLVAWGFYCIALLPIMGLTDVGFMQFSLVADHYQHIAIISVLALVANAWWLWQKRLEGVKRASAIAAAVVVVGLLGCLTWQQSRLYRDAEASYRAALEKNPDCWILHGNLGRCLLERGSTIAAVDHLNEALRLNPDALMAHYDLGRAMTRLHHLPAAITQFQESIRLQPDFFAPYRALSMIYAQTNRPDDALATAEKALAVARSRGEEGLVRQIEEWEQAYKAHESREPNTPLTPKP